MASPTARSFSFLIAAFLVQSTSFFPNLLPTSLRWVAKAGTEIKNPYAENPELSKGFSLNPGVGQNTGLHALPATRNFAYLILPSNVLALWRVSELLTETEETGSSGESKVNKKRTSECGENGKETSLFFLLLAVHLP